MSHSPVDYKDNYVEITDVCVLAVVHFLQKAFREMRKEEAFHSSVVEIDEMLTFLKTVTYYGPGAVFLNFNKVRNVPSLGVLMPAALEKAAECVRKFGEGIPVDYMNNHINGDEGYSFGDFKTRFVLEALSDIGTLFIEKKPESES